MIGYIIYWVGFCAAAWYYGWALGDEYGKAGLVRGVAFAALWIFTLPYCVFSTLGAWKSSR